MNLLFFNRSPIFSHTGGIQRVTYLLASHLYDKGVRIHFLSSFTKQEAEKFYGDVFDNFPTNYNQAYLESSIKGRIHKNVIKQFKDFVKGNQVSVVINQAGTSYNVSRLAFHCKDSDVGKDVKLISVIHMSLLGKFSNIAKFKEIYLKRYRLGWLVPVLKNKLVVSVIKKFYARKQRRHYNELCKKSDKVVLLSEKLIPEIKEILGYVPENVVAINNPTSNDFDMIDLSLKEKKLLWVGRADEGKRLDIFVRIWERVYKKFPDWSADVLGDGSMLSECKKYVVDKNIKRINFHGVVESKDFFRKASIFCFTSIHEGFGMVLLEALQSSTVPILFQSFASCLDIIDDRQNGILIPPFDEDFYATELANLMSNSEYRDILAKNAHKKSQNFSIDKIGEKWHVLLKSL